MIQKFASGFSLNLPFGGDSAASKSQVYGVHHNQVSGQRSTYQPQSHNQLDFQDKGKKFNIYDKISQALSRMDLLLKENFELKREIVFERKKFVDLNSAYSDLRSNLEEGEEVYPTSVNEEFDMGQV